MKLSLLHFRKKRSFRVPRDILMPIRISFVLAFTTLVLTIIAYFISQPVIPLLYSLAQLQDQLVPKHWLFLLPFFSTSIFFIHLIVSISLLKIDKLITRIFLSISIFIQSYILFVIIRLFIIL